MRSIDGEVESSSGSRSGCPSYNLSVTFGDSSPGRGASGGAEKFPMEDEALRNAKASPTRRGGTPSGVTERLYKGKPAHNQKAPGTMRNVPGAFRTKRRDAETLRLGGWLFSGSVRCGLRRPR